MATLPTVWTVNGKEYKLKLTASAICSIEKNVLGGRGILTAFVSFSGMKSEGQAGFMPSLDTMLRIVQHAAAKYNHKLDFAAVQNLFDAYTEEHGKGALMLFYETVYTPLFADFFAEPAGPAEAETGTEGETEA